MENMKPPRFVIEVAEADRDFINTLAAELTGQGPGKYGQKEAIAFLVRCHKAAIYRLEEAAALEQEAGR